MTTFQHILDTIRKDGSYIITEIAKLDHQSNDLGYAQGVRELEILFAGLVYLIHRLPSEDLATVHQPWPRASFKAAVTMSESVLGRVNAPFPLDDQVDREASQLEDKMSTSDDDQVAKLVNDAHNLSLSSNPWPSDKNYTVLAERESNRLAPRGPGRPPGSKFAFRR